MPPAILSFGFRPFFLVASLWGALAVPLWIAVFLGHAEPPTAFGFIDWHVHEMVYGFVSAVVAGFLLTAIPNWTGRLPVRGWALGALVGLWAAGRAAVWFGAILGPWGAAAIDLAFPAAFLLVVAREVIAGRNWRNLPVTAAVALLLFGNVLMHLEPVGFAETARIGGRLGVATVVMLMALIGGRIVPSFTRNWLSKRGETALPAPFSRFDRVTLLVSLAALGFWLVTDSPTTTGILWVAATMQAIRVARWRGWRTGSEPLVWILHVGYAWVPVGLALLGASGLPFGISETAGIHALTAGAMGTMILAVMTRATLGHTGRALMADRWTVTIYIFVLVAAVSRVCGAIDAEHLVPLLVVSSTAWSLAFAVFAVHYGRMLVTPRR